MLALVLRSTQYVVIEQNREALCKVTSLVSQRQMQNALPSSQSGAGRGREICYRAQK